MDRPRILVITNLFPTRNEPNRGIFVKQELAELSRHGEVRVMAPLPWVPFDIPFISSWKPFSGLPQEDVVAGIRVTYPRWFVIPKTGRSLYGLIMALALLPSLLRLKKRFPFDVIYAQWMYPDGFAAAVLGRLLGIPVVQHAHGCDINEYTKYPVRRSQILWAIRNSHAVIAVSKPLRDKIMALGIAADKVKLVPNGIDTALFAPADKTSARRDVGVATDGPIVLFIGSFEEVKGVKYLLDAFELLASRATNPVHLFMIGKGSLAGMIQTSIAEKKLGNSVHVVGEVPHSAIPAWMNACDVLVLPSIREGMPNVILEAMSCGKPVVASRVGGIPDMVTSDDMGLLVPSADAPALSEALERILARGPVARSCADAVLSWREIGDRAFDVLNRALSENKK